MRNMKRGGRYWKLLVLAGGLMMSLPLLAGPPQIVLTPDGHQLLRVEERGGNAHQAATSLRWTLTGGEGKKLTGTIPGTSGPEFDAYPWLFNDLDSGAPVLVWSRHNGQDYDLAVTRFDGEDWSEPFDLVSTRMDEIQPRAYAAPYQGVHLVWNWPGDEASFSYGFYRLDTGIEVVPPERVQADDLPWSTEPQFAPEGGTDEPGTGYTDGGDCDWTKQKCHCKKGGLCVTGPPYEGATVCESFSLVVGIGQHACVVTRESDGWYIGACQTFRGGEGAQELLRSLGKLQGGGCLP